MKESSSIVFVYTTFVFLALMVINFIVLGTLMYTGLITLIIDILGIRYFYLLIPIMFFWPIVLWKIFMWYHTGWYRRIMLQGRKQPLKNIAYSFSKVDTSGGSTTGGHPTFILSSEQEKTGAVEVSGEMIIDGKYHKIQSNRVNYFRLQEMFLPEWKLSNKYNEKIKQTINKIEKIYIYENRILGRKHIYIDLEGAFKEMLGDEFDFKKASRKLRYIRLFTPAKMGFFGLYVLMGVVVLMMP